MRKLSGWQRLWVVISFLLIMPSALVSTILWPIRDSALVSDLANPDCGVWRDLPSGFVSSEYPDMNVPCRAIQAFLYLHETRLRSVTEYDRYVSHKKLTAVGWGMFAWLSTISILYGSGWAVGWVRRGFRDSAK